MLHASASRYCAGGLGDCPAEVRAQAVNLGRVPTQLTEHYRPTARPWGHGYLHLGLEGWSLLEQQAQDGKEPLPRDPTRTVTIEALGQ